MNKAELVNKINALQIEGLVFEEKTEVNNPVLKAILSLATERTTALDQAATLSTELSLKASELAEAEKAKEDAEKLAEELNETVSDLTETVAKLKKAGGKPVLPEVTVGKKKYVFAIPTFQLPKQKPTTADEVVERNEKEELAECIKRGVLVPVEKED